MSLSTPNLRLDILDPALITNESILRPRVYPKLGEHHLIINIIISVFIFLFILLWFTFVFNLATRPWKQLEDSRFLMFAIWFSIFTLVMVLWLTVIKSAIDC